MGSRLASRDAPETLQLFRFTIAALLLASPVPAQD
jgi:hypothetical protein